MEFHRSKFKDRPNGDRCLSRGGNGIWQRFHSTPRRALFTPCKIARGPGSANGLSAIRFTQGVTVSGKQFEFHDNFKKAGQAHRLLDEPWIGTTIFVNEGMSLEAALTEAAPIPGLPKA